MSVIERLNAALSGRYRIESELGEGGMAKVYLAADLKHQRRVAVKVLKPELAEAVGAERFLSEIHTTANLQHPHVLPLFDSGEADGFVFYVMPHVEGRSLKALLAERGRLSVEVAVRIGAAIGDALDHAHRHGFIHRDLKPGNVLLSDGEPLLADFGIALMASRAEDDRLTRTGLSIGTPGYMSPEQAAGERALDSRSDIYSLGALVYEMLTGEPPFSGDSSPAVLARVLTEDAPRVVDRNADVPPEVSHEVEIALSREPGDRHETAGAFSRALRGAWTRSHREPASSRRHRFVGLVAAAAVLIIGGLSLLSAQRTRWARTVAIPEIQGLLVDGQQAEAFTLAIEALEVLPEDPVLADLYASSSAEAMLTSEPPGAAVHYRPFDLEDTTWTAIGTTPTDPIPLPNEEILVRFERSGHHPYTMSFAPSWGAGHADLVRASEERMVSVSAASYSMSGTAVPLEAFFIDEREVTNEAYQAFVDVMAEWDPRYWLAPFEARGVEVDSDRMRADFVDQTGRPGPAGWEVGRYADERGNHPVQGVSWFEAVAYCVFRGKSLPTYHHWKLADGGELTPFDGILQHANLGGRLDGPVPVTAIDSYGPRGGADFAGNVREWVWNAAGPDRYILGGSWQSPPHLHIDFDAADPWSRSLENGFRCARYPTEIQPGLYAPIERPIFDFTDFEPVSDAVFESYLTFYEYDRADVNAARTTVSEAPRWTRELVEFDAAYLDERVTAHLFLPKDAEPPYQTVVYFPGGSAFTLSSSEHLSEMAQLMFLPASGRALLYPVYKGTYERRHDRPARGEAERRQWYVWMVQDVMRAVDFVEDQPDLDEGRLTYLGLSFGAELALPIAVEKRFATTVLIGAALDPAWIETQPDEVAPWNFISRVTTPTILINGQYDFMHPYEESQVPFFDMIDVPEADKRFVVLPVGHVPPNNEVIAHTLRWLDERLGAVR